MTYRLFYERNATFCECVAKQVNDVFLEFTLVFVEGDVELF